MKKKSTWQSAFFNLRLLIGVFVALTGVSLALLATAKSSPGLGFGASSHAPTIQAQQKYQVTTRSPSINPLVPPGFDCSNIRKFGMHKMENLRAGAIMIFCGLAKGGEPGEGGASSAFSKLVQRLTAPVVFGGT